MDDDRQGRVRRWRGNAAAALLAACCGLFAAPVSAQWAVVDLPHTVKTAIGWMAHYQQMSEDYQRQVEQLQTLDRQYEQALVTGEAYTGSRGHRERFQPRGDEDGLAERCGTKPARHARGEEQRSYCISIVRTENRRFNAVVAMLADVDERDAELQAAYAERASIGREEEGKLASNSNRILSIQSQLQNDVESGERLLAAYDTALQALRENHVRVANEVLQGRPGQAVVQGVALKLALRAARERDR